MVWHKTINNQQQQQNSQQSELLAAAGRPHDPLRETVDEVWRQKIVERGGAERWLRMRDSVEGCAGTTALVEVRTRNTRTRTRSRASRRVAPCRGVVGAGIDRRDVDVGEAIFDGRRARVRDARRHRRLNGPGALQSIRGTAATPHLCGARWRRRRPRMAGWSDGRMAVWPARRLSFHSDAVNQRYGLGSFANRND